MQLDRELGAVTCDNVRTPLNVYNKNDNNKNDDNDNGNNDNKNEDNNDDDTHARELNGVRKTSHKHNNKVLSRLR